MIHIYCGDGKGKTTASVGLAVRAAGCGKRVLIARFMKTEDSGEIPSLRKISGIEVIPCKKIFGFYQSMTEEMKEQAKVYYQELFNDTKKRAVTENWDMLVMDEIIVACQYGLVCENDVLEFLRGCPDKLEIVLTGHHPSEEMLSCADYVTEMVKRKHPYDRGVLARKGIEF